MAQNGARRQVNRLPPERRIADIMLAARAIFTEKGYADALISDIAERAGVVEGSIYRFFTNKRELLIRVIEHWYEEMLAEDVRHFDSIRGTWNRLRFLVHHHLLSIRKEPGLTRLMLQEVRHEPGYRQMKLFELNQVYSKRITDLVKAAKASGEFRPDIQPPLVRDLIYGCIEHRIWAFLRNEAELEVEQTADQIADIVYRGLVAEPARSPGREAEILDRLEAVAARLEGVVAHQPAK